MNTNELVNRTECCACGACVSICPKNAISMVKDEYGYKYPSINEYQCINCGKCLKSCICYKENSKKPIKVWAAISNNTDIRESASGGVFASLATSVLNENGIVFGATMDFTNEKPQIYHKGIHKTNELIQLKGSKYVQSDVRSTFKETKKYLDKNKLVLYSGVPCQIAGLKSFLGKDYNNLITVDVICHGVPNEQIFQDYISSIEKKKKKKIKEFIFRDKTLGWGVNGSFKLEGEKTKKYKVYATESSYYTMFLKGELHRNNCYQCKFASKNRPADITIGDYWGIDVQHPELLERNGGIINEKLGCSCIIANTEVGISWIDKYANGLNMWESSFKKVASQNEQLKSPSKRGIYRAEVLDKYLENGYIAIEKCYQKHYSPNLRMLIRVRIPEQLKRIVRRAINKS